MRSPRWLPGASSALMLPVTDRASLLSTALGKHADKSSARGGGGAGGGKSPRSSGGGGGKGGIGSTGSVTFFPGQGYIGFGGIGGTGATTSLADGGSYAGGGGGYPGGSAGDGGGEHGGLLRRLARLLERKDGGAVDVGKALEGGQVGVEAGAV